MPVIQPLADALIEGFRAQQGRQISRRPLQLGDHLQPVLVQRLVGPARLDLRLHHLSLAQVHPQIAVVDIEEKVPVGHLRPGRIVVQSGLSHIEKQLHTGRLPGRQAVAGPPMQEKARLAHPFPLDRLPQPMVELLAHLPGRG